MEQELDSRVRTAVYEGAVASGTPPTRQALAALLSLTDAEVGASLERLAATRALVLQPESREVLMANPFSAVPTPFAVATEGRAYHANCIWDGLGIPAMLRSDATVTTACACCGESARVRVSGGRLVDVDWLAHFGVPARHWWADIVFN